MIFFLTDLYVTEYVYRTYHCLDWFRRPASSIILVQNAQPLKYFKLKYMCKIFEFQNVSSLQGPDLILGFRRFFYSASVQKMADRYQFEILGGWNNLNMKLVTFWNNLTLVMRNHSILSNDLDVTEHACRTYNAPNEFVASFICHFFSKWRLLK